MKRFFSHVAPLVALPFLFFFISLSEASLLDTFIYNAKALFGFLGPNSNINPNLESSIKAEVMRTNFSAVDYMTPGLPKVRIGARVVDLFNGWHFDDILSDSPTEIRPASVVVFYNSSNPTCFARFSSLNFDQIAETQLPARSQVFLSRYDMYSAKRRAWYEFTPEMDLEERFQVKNCPEIVFASRSCHGFTDWCERGVDEKDPNLKILGCKDFKESCPEHKRKVFVPDFETFSLGDIKSQIISFIKENLKTDGRPKVTRFLGSYKEQGDWLLKREHTTNDNHFRNVYLSQAFPAFTKRGFTALKTPQPLQDWLLDFVKDYAQYEKTEYWNAESTQLSFHELPTSFIDMDKVRAKKEQMARKYLEQLLEEWSGLKPLELTSFYGMRFYHAGAWLRQHVDRIDTHVISVTISVAKLNFTRQELEFLYDITQSSETDSDKEAWIQNFQYKPWPLQVTDWTGQQVAYDHPPGTMILYESSKLPHGRNTRNFGGVHLGCFVHFKPKDMHTTNSKHWEDVAKTARDNQQAHTLFASYRSTAELELPENEIEFANMNIGEQSVWNGHKKNKNTQQTDIDSTFAVEFRNRAGRELRVFWQNPDTQSLLFQGTVFPGSSVNINTYHGHRFVWCEAGDESQAQDKPVPVKYGASFVMDIGKRVYEYNLKPDGSTFLEVNSKAEL